MRIVLKKENDRRSRGERDERIISAGESLDEKEGNVYESIEDAKREKGDMFSGFKYTL